MLAAHCLAEQKRRNRPVSRHKDISLFMNAPGRAELEKAKEYFCNLQDKAFENLRDKMTARTASASVKSKDVEFPEASTGTCLTWSRPVFEDILSARIAYADIPIYRYCIRECRKLQPECFV